MYECPASTAPEPNNYEVFFSSFSRAERKIHFSPASQPPACCPFPRQNLPFPKETRTVPGSPCFSGLCDCCNYLQRRLWSVSPASLLLIVCQSSPRSGRQTAPLPFQTAAGRRPKQKALRTNHSAPNSSPTLKIGQSEKGKGGTITELQIQLKHFLVVVSSDSKRVPIVTAQFQL